MVTPQSLPHTTRKPTHTLTVLPWRAHAYIRCGNCAAPAVYLARFASRDIPVCPTCGAKMQGGKR